MPNEVELLKEIITNDNIVIAIIAASSALLGSSITAIIHYLGLRNSNKIKADKVRADLISTERLRWLQELRNEYSIYFTELDYQITFLKRPIQEMENYQNSLNEFSINNSKHYHMIITLLNPDKEEQLKLRLSITKARKFFLNHLEKKQLARLDIDMNIYEQIKDDSLIALTVIGKETWSKIKELK